MNGFERRREQKKESIRRAAMELFKAHGIRRVSVKDIATEAAVSQVTIYNYFGSKEGLVRDVLKTWIVSALERYRAIIQGEGTFLEKLEVILFDKTEMTRQYHGELMRTVISSDQELQQFFESVIQREIRPLLADFFDEGRRQGYINPELSQETLLAYVEMFRSFAFAHFRASMDTEQNTRSLRELWTLFYYGLMGDSKKNSGH